MVNIKDLCIMKKYVAIVVVLCLIIYSAYFTTVQLPDLVQTKALQTLRQMGFTSATIEKSDIRISAARFKNIALDDEALSTIKRLELSYSPLNLLLHKQPRSIAIQGLSLIGEFSDDGLISIAGWDRNHVRTITPQNTPQTLSIEKGRIALLTDTIGGITLDFDLQARKKGSELTLTGRLRSQQKHISAIADLTGFINADGLLQINAGLERGKLDIAPIKATRVNGQVRLTIAPNTAPQISGQFQAGGLNLYGMPWQNATGSLQSDLQDYIISADMKSLGHESLELGLTLENQRGALSLSGAVHAENIDDALAYLEQFSSASLDTAPLQRFKNEANTAIVLEDFKNNKLGFLLKNEEGKPLERGHFIFRDNEIETLEILKD